MTSCFAVTEHSWQGPATSCKIFPGAEMAETWWNSGAEKVTLLDATPCYGSALITSPSIMVCYASCVTSGDPDTRPDRRHVMHQPHVRWEVSCCSIIEIMYLCIHLNHVSGFSSLSPCSWECDKKLLRKWNNSGNKRSDLGKARRSKSSRFKALLLWTERSNLFLAFGQRLYLGEMENKDFVHQF